MSHKLVVKGIYADGMVLQRNATNCIFGTCKPDSEISLIFKGENSVSKSDSNGEWKIEFNPGEAGGPYQMEIRNGSDVVSFKDIYVGEVWLLSGQSNAQLPMERMKFSYPDEFELPENNNIRMITIPISWSFDGEKDSVENPVWVHASKENLGGMSGTGYFFAKKLSQELKVPVGIVNASQGGSPIASWIDKRSLLQLQNTEMFISQLEKYENLENVKAKQKEESEVHALWDNLVETTDEGIKGNWEKLPYSQIAAKWSDCTIPGDIDIEGSAGTVWFKKQVMLTQEQVKKFDSIKTWLWMGTIVDADKIWVNGVKVGETGYCYPPRRYVVPAGTLHEGENTITVRVLKNSHFGNIRFYTEKPYFLFTENVKICPTAVRHVEKFSELTPATGEKIALSGIWKKMTGTKVEDNGPQTFFEWIPTALYNSMLAPCFNYAVAGALWYQGESDVWHPDEYRGMLLKLIMLWREKFRYAVNDMPFVIMQLPNWSDGNGENYMSNDIGWAQMRQEELLVSEIAEKTGVAITIDAGEWNDLHPEKKRTGGTRAAIEALKIAYEKDMPSAPKAIFTERKGDHVVVQFEVGKEKLKTVTGNEIPGFYFLYSKDNEMKMIEAKGTIISDSEVSVPVPQVQGIFNEIRYLWADSPAPVNLYSTADLPAQAFRAILPE